MWKIVFFTSILLRGALFISQCPPQCLCSDGNIVCTCESTASAELNIHSLGGSFARSFVVHSCAKVTVQNGSFSGVMLQERLTFVAIGRLIIEPGAFYGILQSPKQVIVEQCSLPRLLSGSFEGLSRLQHIWFRKSSIDIIEKGSFYGVGPLDYLYFRETTIGYLQQQAFGGIRHARHVFFRGGVKIASSEPQLFGNSSIGELVLDEVVAHLHESFLLDLGAPVIINNCNLNFTSRGETIPVSGISSNSLIITESKLNSFSPLLNHHFQKIDVATTKINKIRAADSQLLGYLPLVLRLSIEDSEIGSFEPLSLAHTKIAELKVKRSRLGKICQTSFAGSKISKITIDDTKIEEIQPDSFVEARIEKFSLEGGKVSRLTSKALGRSTIRRLEMKKVEIRHLGEAVFGDLHNLTAIETKIFVSASRPFKNSKITSATFLRSDFHGTLRRSFFDGLAPVRLSITESRFDCDAKDCEMNAMLFNPLTENLLWRFEQNSCDSNTTREMVCNEASITEIGSLRCQRTALIADCTCIGSSATLPAFDVQLLVVGDCDEVILTNEHAGSPVILYLYRIAKGDFVQAPRSLRAIKIFNSAVVLRPEFGASASLDQFWLEKSHLLLEDGALNHATVGSLRLSQSKVTGLSYFSLEGTEIEQLTINGSRLETAAPLLQRTNRLSLVDSILGSPDGLAAVRFAHLANNTILCCCERDCSFVHPECRHYFPQVKCLSPSAYRSIFPPVSATFYLFLVPLIYIFK